MGKSEDLPLSTIIKKMIEDIEILYNNQQKTLSERLDSYRNMPKTFILPRRRNIVEILVKTLESNEYLNTFGYESQLRDLNILRALAIKIETLEKSLNESGLLEKLGYIDSLIEIVKNFEKAHERLKQEEEIRKKIQEKRNKSLKEFLKSIS